MKDHTPEQVPRGGNTKHFFEAHAKVSIEVVEDQMDAPRVRVDVFEQVLEKATKSTLARCSVTSTTRRPPLGSTATNRSQVPARAYW